MSQPVTIAIDAMGGDRGPATTVAAALTYRRENGHDNLCLLLVGQEQVLREELRRQQATESDHLKICHASELVAMDESPALALRGKKDSSMRVALNLVKQGKADACVSAGNTGALMATARFVLKTLPDIDRPALCTALPSARGHVHMLDLGANVDSSAEHLLQFAVMGSALANVVDDIAQPRVGLLNIGAEDIKGNEQVRQAAALLSSSQLNYAGFIEGDGIFLGDCDVVVCDGFVGNISLKTGEGLAKLIRQFMQEEFKRTWFSRAAAIVALPVLRALKRRIDPRRHNGASLLGLQGIVIKSHGSADEMAFANAIQIAVLEVEKALPTHIRSLLDTMPSEHITQRAAS